MKCRPAFLGVWPEEPCANDDEYAVLFESGQSDNGVYVGVAAVNFVVDDADPDIVAEGCGELLVLQKIH